MGQAGEQFRRGDLLHDLERATRVAALLSGDVDWADPIPLQDVARVNASGVAKVLQGPELRTIFLGFDQYRPELRYSNVKGKNPFKDVRVREAFYLAIDENAIKDKVMRGAATPSALMISPSAIRLVQGVHASGLRSGEGEEAAGRRRLSRAVSR